MTNPSPELPALQRLQDERELFERLSHFQERLSLASPVPPQLPAVLKAAQPAFEAGFAYSASMWSGELQVTIHRGSAELGSCAPASPTSYSDTCARLLAGLLGIPLHELEHSCEAEPSQPATAACGLRSVPDPVEPGPQEPQAPAAEAEPDEFETVGTETVEPEPTPAADIHRPLSEDEKLTAITMIKAMATEQRKAFTKTFREVFQVPPEAKQVAPFITELQHLHFVDRYTVEAAGGIAA